MTKRSRYSTPPESRSRLRLNTEDAWGPHGAIVYRQIVVAHRWQPRQLPPAMHAEYPLRMVSCSCIHENICYLSDFGDSVVAFSRADVAQDSLPFPCYSPLFHAQLLVILTFMIGTQPGRTSRSLPAKLHLIYSSIVIQHSVSRPRKW